MTNVPFATPPNTTRLEAEITIFVPSTQGIKKQRPLNKKEMEERVNTVRSYLSKTFGGYTSVSAIGGYMMKDRRLIQENVVKVTSFGERAKAIQKRDELLRKLKMWAFYWGQETLGMEFETDFFMIPREIRKR